ncbi:hypothetical protein Tco_1478795 [Tanacetum coccineum]
MMVQAQEEMGEGSTNPTDPHHIPIITQPSTSQPQNKHKPRKPKKKDTQSSGLTYTIAQDTIAQTGFENVSKTLNDPLLSGEDSIQLKELMDFYTKLQQRVLDLENIKTAQAQEITSLKLRVKRLEKKGGSRTHKLKRLYKISRSARVDVAEKEVSTADPVTTTGEVVTTTSVEISTTSPTEATIADELTLAQTLIEIKIVKPKVKGIIIKELVESTKTTIKTISSQEPSQETVQDKGKGKMVEPEPVKKFSKKDQIRLDEELAFKLQAEEEEERLAKEKDEANVRAERSSKRAGEDLQQESTKKQKMDDVEETAEVVEDKERVELQSLMKIVPDEEEVSINAIPLATKPLSIVDWKIIKEGNISYFQIIRADGSSKRYSAFIQRLKSFDREDLETL